MVNKNFVSQLFTFAYFPNYDKAVAYLAESLADKEEWDFTDATDKSIQYFATILSTFSERSSLKTKWDLPLPTHMRASTQDS